MEQLIRDEPNFKDILPDVVSFSEEVVNDLSTNDLNIAIDHFYNTGELDLKEFEYKKEFNPELSNHPQLQWLRKTK
ncbi:MAG: hypothetical protein ACOC5D_06640 [Thermoplasmatota archaeon]